MPPDSPSAIVLSHEPEAPPVLAVAGGVVGGDALTGIALTPVEGSQGVLTRPTSGAAGALNRSNAGESGATVSGVCCVNVGSKKRMGKSPGTKSKR